MTSSVRTTIIVWIIAAIGIALAVTTSGSDRSDGAGDASAARTLPGVDAMPVDEVQEITLQRAGEPAMHFERTGDGWRQTAPFPHPMDPYSMRQLAAQAAQIEAVDALEIDEFSNDLSPASLGLDPPNAIVTYRWPGGSLELRLGRKGIAGRAYLQVEGDERVYIVNQPLHNRAVEMSPKEWRDRTLFSSASIESDSIMREGGNVRFVMERDGRRWRLSEPVSTRLDQTAIEAYINVLGGARSGGFIADQPDDLQRFGLEPPTAVIEVASTRNIATDEDNLERVVDTQRLRVGSPVGAGTDDRFGLIDGRDTVIRIPAETLHTLFISPAELIDPTGSGVVPADVKSLAIRTDETELRFDRDLERWHESNTGTEVPASVVNQLLSQLTELRASEIAIEPYPVESEVATVTLYGFGDQPLDTVRIARDATSGKWALENGDNVLRLFPADFELRLQPQDFGLSAPNAAP